MLAVASLEWTFTDVIRRAVAEVEKRSRSSGGAEPLPNAVGDEERSRLVRNYCQTHPQSNTLLCWQRKRRSVRNNYPRRNQSQ